MGRWVAPRMQRRAMTARPPLGPDAWVKQPATFTPTWKVDRASGEARHGCVVSIEPMTVPHPATLGAWSAAERWEYVPPIIQRDGPRLEHVALAAFVRRASCVGIGWRPTRAAIAFQPGDHAVNPTTKLSLITGANRGLGEALARRLAARRPRARVGARDLAAGERVAEALRRSGGRAEAVLLDVTNARHVDDLASRLDRTGETLEVLANNAGLYEGDPAAIVDVDFRAPVALTEALIPHLAGGARVVMVSSGLGSLDAFPRDLARRLNPPPDMPGLVALVDAYLADAHARRRRGWPSAYTVAKAALNAATRIPPRGSARAPVNAICPGWVRTRMGGAGAPRSIDEGVAGLVWAATLPPDGPNRGILGRPRAPLVDG